jgi:hypothetical protein
MHKDANNVSGSGNQSISSGSSPGETLAMARHLCHIRSADIRPPFPAPHWRGEARPHGARCVRLRNRHPSLPYLTYLVSELGYDSDAAFAVLARSWGFHRGRPDRRRKKAVSGADRQAERQPSRDYQRFDYGDNLYVPEGMGRRTLGGGGFTGKQVSQGLLKMRASSLVKGALNEIVYGRRSTLEVSNKTGIPVENLYVYASRLRERIRCESQAVAA